MEFVRYLDMSHGEWTDHIDKIEGTTFRYTVLSIDFETEYAQSIIQNESFIAFINNKPVAVGVVYIDENSDGIRTISWGGRYCVAPLVDEKLSYKLQERYIREVYCYIDKVIQKFNCETCLFMFDPLCNPEQKRKLYNYNFMMKYGYEERNTLTQILDLRKEEEELYSDIKNGHRGHIKKGKDYEIEIYNADNMQDRLIDVSREIYEYDAGMVTRNSEMMHHYLKYIKNGNAVLGFAKYNGKYIATIIVTYYKNTAYYSLYAEKTDQMNGKPAGHKLQWEMIKYLKRIGIKFYEIGEQVFGNTHYESYERKLINISTFKREFGGYTIELFRGIKKESKSRMN